MRQLYPKYSGVKCGVIRMLLETLSHALASTSAPQRLPMVQHFEARMLLWPKKLFYLILSRVTGSQGSKIHPDSSGHLE